MADHRGTGLKNLNVLLDQVDEFANDVIVDAALKLQGMLRDNPPIGTPIDTGWASSNWTLSLDVPREDVLGSKENIISEDPGKAEAMKFDINVNNSIWLTNNVPYIARLNDGHSQQSPPGWVDTAIDVIELEYGGIK